MASIDLALVNAGELVTCEGEGDELGVVEGGAFTVSRGRVAWVGTTKEFKRKSFGKPGRVVDAGGRLVTPGLVDPHTHLAFAGTREDELERKVAGESYVSILEKGGGIARTIRDTRGATERSLAAQSAQRLTQLVRNGVTTVEVKTGYGQRLKDELKMIGAIGKLGKMTGAEVVTTFLGVHARPPEARTSREYVDYAVKEMLPAVAGMKGRPTFSDCFCEEGVFSSEECAKYLRASARLGFACKVHADEFADSGGAVLAADTGCVSADHLVKSPRESVEQMGKRGVVGVLLPGTSLYSNIPYADARMVREAGCTVALGTDLSPNSWIESPQVVMALACNGLRLTPGQALVGFTRNAAMALGREDIGRLTPGSSGDFVVHDYPSYRFVPYRLGGQTVKSVYKSGREIFSAGD